jgi:hypothetical protein
MTPADMRRSLSRGAKERLPAERQSLFNRLPPGTVTAEGSAHAINM